MSGRIQVSGPDGAVTKAGDERRYDTGPRSARWNRFTLTFADGGRLVLQDPRQLTSDQLNPDLDALGPDAAQVTPAEFRALITKGRIAVKARLLDQVQDRGGGQPAGRRDPLAGQGVTTGADRYLHPGAGQPPSTGRSSPLWPPPSPGSPCAHLVRSSQPAFRAAPARATARRWCTAPLAAGPPGGAPASRPRPGRFHPGRPSPGTERPPCRHRY